MDDFPKDFTPPTVTDADVIEFIQIWEDEFGDRLSIAEGRFQATRVLGLYALLAEAEANEKYENSRGHGDIG